MADPTPPPEEPLPEQSRARIRAELLDVAQRSPAQRSWVVPAAVAAAVVLVVGLAAWAVQAGRTADDGAGPAAGGGSSLTSPLDAAGPSWSMTWSSSPSPAVGTEQPDLRQVGRGSCVQEAENALPHAEPVASFDDGTSFLVAGDRFVLCDVRGGVTTVHHALPLAPERKVATYQVSSVYAAGGQVTRVAGGVVPDGATAFDVGYTFPDGQTVPAETIEGGGRTWWRVAHTYESRGNEMNDPPIEVSVSWSGRQEHFTLDWGLDTCAQANHGC